MYRDQLDAYERLRVNTPRNSVDPLAAELEMQLKIWEQPFVSNESASLLEDGRPVGGAVY